MMAEFKKEAFDVRGEVTVFMPDGRKYFSQFPLAVWKWLQGKNWASIVVYDANLQQSYGWDRW